MSEPFASERDAEKAAHKESQFYWELKDSEGYVPPVYVAPEDKTGDKNDAAASKSDGGVVVSGEVSGEASGEVVASGSGSEQPSETKNKTKPRISNCPHWCRCWACYEDRKARELEEEQEQDARRVVVASTFGQKQQQDTASAPAPQLEVDIEGIEALLEKNEKIWKRTDELVKKNRDLAASVKERWSEIKSETKTMESNCPSPWWSQCSGCCEEWKDLKARMAQKAIDVREAARKKIEARAAREAKENPKKVNRGQARQRWRKDRREDFFGFDELED